MSELTGLYKALAIKKLQDGDFTLTDLVKAKNFHDINQFLTTIDLQDGDENNMDYEKGLGLRDDDDLSRLMERFDVYEVVSGKDEAYRYFRPDNGEDQFFRLKVNHSPDSDGYLDTFYDFNTLEEADENEIIDDDILDAFFGSATFLMSPNSDGNGAPHCYMWDDFDAVSQRVQAAQANNEPLFVYTLTDESGEGYIDSGYRIVNRMGYFLADKEITAEFPLRYW